MNAGTDSRNPIFIDCIDSDDEELLPLASLLHSPKKKSGRNCKRQRGNASSCNQFVVAGSSHYSSQHHEEEDRKMPAIVTSSRTMERPSSIVSSSTTDSPTINFLSFQLRVCKRTENHDELFGQFQAALWDPFTRERIGKHWAKIGLGFYVNTDGASDESARVPSLVHPTKNNSSCSPDAVLACVQAQMLQYLLFENETSFLFGEQDMEILDSSYQAAQEALARTIGVILARAALQPSRGLKGGSQKGEVNIMLPDQGSWKQWTLSLLDPDDKGNEQLLTEIVSSFLLGRNLPGQDSKGNDTESLEFAPITVFQNNGGLMNLLLSIYCTRPHLDDDFDSHVAADTKLLTKDGCSQELINLILTGQAVSNVFDGEFWCGEDLIMNGVARRPSVGFLTELEARERCAVGEFYKDPYHPIWVVESKDQFMALWIPGLAFDINCSNAASLQHQHHSPSRSPVAAFLYGLKDGNLIPMEISFTKETGICSEKERDTTIADIQAVLKTKWPRCNIKFLHKSKSTIAAATPIAKLESMPPQHEHQHGTPRPLHHQQLSSFSWHGRSHNEASMHEWPEDDSTRLKPPPTAVVSNVGSVQSSTPPVAFSQRKPIFLDEEDFLSESRSESPLLAESRSESLVLSIDRNVPEGRPTASDDLYSLDEFKKSWKYAEIDFGFRTESIEQGKLVRCGNNRIASGIMQEKAQYGRLLFDACDKLFQDVLQLRPEDIFVDIGHGIGSVVLQAAYTYGCEARGIEMMEGRAMLAEQYAENLAQQRSTPLIREVNNAPVGKVCLKQGDLVDPANKNFLTVYDRPGMNGNMKLLVNNFNGLFADRCASSKQKYHLDNVVAGLFALLRPGDQLVTLHKLTLPPPYTQAADIRLRHGLAVNDCCSFYELEEMKLGLAKDCVSWSAGGSCTDDIMVYLYTRIPQFTDKAVVLCCNRNCRNARANTPIPAVVWIPMEDSESGSFPVATGCACGIGSRMLRKRQRVGYDESIYYVDTTEWH